MTRFERGFTLIELMIVIAIIAIIAAIAIPSILAATRAANERNASGSLHSIISQQVRFKSSDADGNSINDYYTADVAGMYYLTPTGQSVGLRFVELSMALADGNTDPTQYTADPPHIASPKSGYWYQALLGFEYNVGVTANYGTRNLDRFGFVSYPNAYLSSGRNLFIISENGTMFKRDPGTANFATSMPTIAAADTNGALTTSAPAFAFTPFNPGANGPLVAGPWSKMD